MSTWMSIGFEPNQMDPVMEPNPQAAISGVQDDEALRQNGGLDQRTPSEFGVIGGLNDSRKHWIASAIKHLVARHRTLRVQEWRF